MSEILRGQIGNFGGIPIFTDCAVQPNQLLINALPIMAANRGKPHTCPNAKRCSRWILETEE